MSTESEVILERYKQREKEADALGRLITVRRLKPSEQTKVAGYCAELSGYDEVTVPSGDKIQVPHRMPLLIAAAVCMIDEFHIPFANSRKELDAVYDRLDAEGLAAAGTAVARLAGEDVGDPLEAAKNL